MNPICERFQYVNTSDEHRENMIIVVSIRKSVDTNVFQLVRTLFSNILTIYMLANRRSYNVVITILLMERLGPVNTNSSAMFGYVSTKNFTLP